MEKKGVEIHWLTPGDKASRISQAIDMVNGLPDLIRQ